MGFKSNFTYKSSLKAVNVFLLDLAQMSFRVPRFQTVSKVLICQKPWPPLLKFEHRVKLQFLANNSKTKTCYNLTEDYQDDKIYLPRNFKVNPITHLRVVALFQQVF
jgi:hypothetical protein